VLGPLVLRPTLILAVLLVGLMVLLGSCSRESDDPVKAASSVGDSVPEAAVEQRWQEYWDARIASENLGRLDTETFATVARAKAVEAQQRRLRNYREHDLVRVGRPSFREAEVRMMGDSATVLACLDADAWTAEVEGQPWSAQKYGWEATGNVLKQVDGAWFVVDELSSSDVADMGKSC